MDSALPFELAGEFFDAPSLVAVQQLTRGLVRSTSLATMWTGIFRRRYPCLAALPVFQGPLRDGRGLIKKLFAATPPPEYAYSNSLANIPAGWLCHRDHRGVPYYENTASGHRQWERPTRDASYLPPGVHSKLWDGSILPAAPRDAEGRALPTYNSIIIAGQIVARGATALSSSPFLTGSRPFQGAAGSASSFRTTDQYWEIEVPLVPYGAKNFEEWRTQTIETMSLEDWFEIDDETGETSRMLRSVVEAACRQVDARLRQELFVVAGDRVWRLDALRACIDNVRTSQNELYPNFDRRLEVLNEADEDATITWNMLPRAPLEFVFNGINCAMKTHVNLGAYEYMNGVLEYSFMEDDLDTQLTLCANWSQCARERLVDEHAERHSPRRDGHAFFCQLLAATRHVRFTRFTRGYAS